MSTGFCPICDEKTVGKPVRRVHFCEKHREIAIMIRDSEDLKKIEKKGKRHFLGFLIFRTLFFITSMMIIAF